MRKKASLDQPNDTVSEPSALIDTEGEKLPFGVSNDTFVRVAASFMEIKHGRLPVYAEEPELDREPLDDTVSRMAAKQALCLLVACEEVTSEYFRQHQPKVSRFRKNKKGEIIRKVRFYDGLKEIGIGRNSRAKSRERYAEFLNGRFGRKEGSERLAREEKFGFRPEQLPEIRDEYEKWSEQKLKIMTAMAGKIGAAKRDSLRK